MEETISKRKTMPCYHCGDTCANDSIRRDDKVFCCEGCCLVYEILQENSMCTYYDLNSSPGASRKKQVREDQFACLDMPRVAEKFTSFRNNEYASARFYLPQIHCSSCLWLLEHLPRINPGILTSEVNFFSREITVSYDHQRISLREVAGVLASVGYEPYLSLNDLDKTDKPKLNKSKIYKLGVAGFSFGNIMLMSLPEYFSGDIHITDSWAEAFRYINFLLALPVFLYSATEFYKPAWQGIKKRFLNIDIPVCLAIIITFTRSVAEVFSGTGPGFFDSFAGIVFFMLAGRVMQDRTFRRFSFERDYRSYFPIAVNKLVKGEEMPATLPELDQDDMVVIHHGELVPADAVLLKGEAVIDYSFVTGESVPVNCGKGEIIYAGGRQTGGDIYMKLIKKVSQSYLTSLWNKRSGRQQENKNTFVEDISGLFSLTVLLIALKTAVYWSFTDPSKIWPSVTAILIIACPCVLLLAATYTNGHFLRIFAARGLFLRNAGVLEQLRSLTHVVLDKTGTLTRLDQRTITFHGDTLSPYQTGLIVSLAAQSTHPLSRALVAANPGCSRMPVDSFREHPGLGIEGWIDNHHVRLGSPDFILAEGSYPVSGAGFLVAIDHYLPGHYSFSSQYRRGIRQTAGRLASRYGLSLLSGDHSEEEERTARRLFGPGSTVLFGQSPGGKAAYIADLQCRGEKVLMAGDGLNDANALRQSNAGIAVTEDTNHFSPACDGILEAGSFHLLPVFLQLSHTNRHIITGAFVFSVIYNLTGLYFAVQGILSPLLAAVIMPASSLSIILLTYISSELSCRKAFRRTGIPETPVSD